MGQPEVETRLSETHFLILFTGVSIITITRKNPESRARRVFAKRCAQVVKQLEFEALRYDWRALREHELHNTLNDLVQEYRTSAQYVRQAKIANRFGWKW